MSDYQIAAQARIAGSANGTFQDDLTDPNIGNWPAAQNIARISQIEVARGSIIDSISVTYRLSNGTTVTKKHGGAGGTKAPPIVLNGEFDPYQLLSADTHPMEYEEKSQLVAVYGRHLTQQSEFGPKTIVELSFVIVDSTQSIPVVRVETVKGGHTDATATFKNIGALIACSTFAAKPSNKPDAYIQGIGFSKILASAQ